MYYERMIFNIEIPTIHQDVNGNQLHLSITGCKAMGEITYREK